MLDDSTLDALPKEVLSSVADLALLDGTLPVGGRIDDEGFLTGAVALPLAAICLSESNPQNQNKHLLDRYDRPNTAAIAVPPRTSALIAPRRVQRPSHRSNGAIIPVYRRFMQTQSNGSISRLLQRQALCSTACDQPQCHPDFSLERCYL